MAGFYYFFVFFISTFRIEKLCFVFVSSSDACIALCYVQPFLKFRLSALTFLLTGVT